jgi:hypothetical protein
VNADEYLASEHFDTADLRNDDTRTVSDLLVERALKRVNPGRSSSTMQGDAWNAIFKSIRRLSFMQVGVMRQSFGASGGFDFTGLGDACCWFASGGLRHSHGDLPNTEPDSAHVVLFAEFASLAIEVEGDVSSRIANWHDLHDLEGRPTFDATTDGQAWTSEVDLWRKVLPLLVGMIEIYGLCYPAMNKKSAGYLWGYCPPPVSVPDQNTLDTHYKFYRSLSNEDAKLNEAWVKHMTVLCRKQAKE